MTVDLRLGRLLLLGETYGTYGAVGSTSVGAQSAAAITVGADPNSPSHRWKYDAEVPNEDCLCLIDAGDWVAMAVADAHYGPESSHLLIRRLHDIWARIRPTDIGHLQQMVEFLRSGDPATTESETTLLVSVFDRTTGAGFGLSFGDSTFTIVGPGRLPQPINPHDHRFVTPAVPTSFRNGAVFSFNARPGEVLLIHTDGIDGCHYREPDTSVQPHHIATIASNTNYEPLALVDGVTALALRGVDGNPGGQDNIVIAAVTV